MAKRSGKIHTIQRGILSKPSGMIPARAGKITRHKSGEVRQINPAEYNRTGRGQHVFDQCAHKIGQFAQIQPMSKESKAYKLATQRG